MIDLTMLKADLRALPAILWKVPFSYKDAFALAPFLLAVCSLFGNDPDI
jgi:hypothetical protein